MKTYTKIHKDRKVAIAHAKRIKARGGKVEYEIIKDKIKLFYSYPDSVDGFKQMAKNAWSSVKFGSYLVKYSKANKTWQVFKGNKLITDYYLKSNAVKYAEKQHHLKD